MPLLHRALGFVAVLYSHQMVQDVLDLSGRTMTSEERFAVAMSSMFVKATMPAPEDPGSTTVISRGIKLADIAYGERGGKLTFSKSVPADFVAYVAEHIEELHDAYHRQARKQTDQKRS